MQQRQVCPTGWSCRLASGQEEDQCREHQTRPLAEGALGATWGHATRPEKKPRDACHTLRLRISGSLSVLILAAVVLVVQGQRYRDGGGDNGAQDPGIGQERAHAAVPQATAYHLVPIHDEGLGL